MCEKNLQQMGGFMQTFSTTHEIKTTSDFKWGIVLPEKCKFW